MGKEHALRRSLGEGGMGLGGVSVECHTSVEADPPRALQWPKHIRQNNSTSREMQLGKGSVCGGREWYILLEQQQSMMLHIILTCCHE